MEVVVGYMPFFGLLYDECWRVYHLYCNFNILSFFMTSGEGKEGESGNVADPVDGAFTLANATDYDSQGEEFFRSAGSDFFEYYINVAKKLGVPEANAWDMCQNYLEGVIERKKLDFSRRPDLYLFRGVRTNIVYQLMTRRRGDCRRAVYEEGFCDGLLSESVLDPRVSAEQEGKCVVVEALEDFKVVAEGIFKRMPFRDACIFFLHYVCGCSLKFVSGLFGLVPEFMFPRFKDSCSAFMDQVMELKQSEVNQLSFTDVSMFDDSIIDMIIKILLERAEFRREYREDTVIDYPLLRDLLGRPFREFMGIIESVKEERSQVVRVARRAVRKAFEAALVE